MTDGAATMSAVFETFVSQNHDPYSDRWFGYIAHQLNTAMSHASDDSIASNIQEDVEGLKTPVPIFKKSGLNDKIPSWKALKQEVPTISGSTFDMVECFISEASNVIKLIEEADQDTQNS